MECEKIREKFSSLLEGDLDPSEEKSVTNHLVSCSGCQNDFETFKKTMNWLHSVDELEAPEGFLTEIYQRIEDRKRMGSRQGWIHRLSRMNLPVQAVAMVAIVFAVLYLTKIMPPETTRSKKVDQPVAQHIPSEKKSEDAITTTPADEGKAVQQQKAEPEGTSVAELKAPPPEETKADRAMLAKESPSPASVFAPIEEIVLRTSDPEKSLLELQAVVKQFGGEIVKEEENVLLASLPTGSLSELKKEVEQRTMSKRTGVATPQGEAPRVLKLSPKAKGTVAGKKKEMAPPMAGQEGRITVRFVLIKE